MTPPTRPACPRRADWLRRKWAGGGSEGSGRGIGGGAGLGVDDFDLEVFAFFFGGAAETPLEWVLLAL